MSIPSSLEYLNTSTGSGHAISHSEHDRTVMQNINRDPEIKEPDVSGNPTVVLIGGPSKVLGQVGADSRVLTRK